MRFWLWYLRRPSSTSASMTEPMTCPTCAGNSELVRCPPTCDGSHIQDEPYPCRDCGGSGVVGGEDS